MKTIGLIGGLSWRSTMVYYRVINEYLTFNIDHQSAAQIIINSLNAEYFVQLLNQGREEVLKIFVLEEIRKLERVGVDFIGLACNTVHIFFDFLQANSSLKIFNIADAVLEELISKRIFRVALLATKFTYANNFYADRFGFSGIETYIPPKEDIFFLNELIFEFCSVGKYSDLKGRKLRSCLDNLLRQNVEAIVLGCTELEFLLGEKGEADLLILDSTKLHAKKLAKLAAIPMNDLNVSSTKLCEH